VLLSYQASPHDLTLVLLPIFLTYTYLRNTPGLPSPWRRLSLFTLAVLFLPLLHVYAIRAHLYVLLVLPLVALVLLNHVEIHRFRVEEARL
jgi:hypothetical protein